MINLAYDYCAEKIGWKRTNEKEKIAFYEKNLKTFNRMGYLNRVQFGANKYDDEEWIYDIRPLI